MTSSALAWAGIRIEWVACASNRAATDCPAMNGPADMTIRVDDTVEEIPDIADRGWPRRMCDVRDGVATLPIDALVTQARARALPEATAIARALLHQIGHRFMGAEHTPEGLLAARDVPSTARSNEREPRLGVHDVVRLGAAIVSRLEGAPGTGLDHERLVSVDPHGAIGRIVDGHAHGVVIGHALDADLRVPGANLTIVHNHPSGTGFSGDDLVLLTRPGVARIHVIGHDGSLYEASAGPRFQPRRFASQVYPLATRAAIMKSMPFAGRAVFRTHIAHLIASALHEAGVIDYRARLRGERSWSQFQNRAPFIALVLAVADTVRHDLDGAVKSDRIASKQP